MDRHFALLGLPDGRPHYKRSLYKCALSGYPCLKLLRYPLQNPAKIRGPNFTATITKW